MGATKFIRVSCELPAGVTLGSAMKSPMVGSKWLESLLSRSPVEFLDLLHVTDDTRVQSTEPLTLTLECPAAVARDLAQTLLELSVQLGSE